jgi:hypothetical protein
MGEIMYYWIGRRRKVKRRGEGLEGLRGRMLLVLEASLRYSHLVSDVVG